MVHILKFLETGIQPLLGGILGSILTNFINDKKQEKEFINKVVCSQDECIDEIFTYIEFIETYLPPYNFSDGNFLENRCKSFRIKKEKLKEEDFKTSEKVKNQIKTFNRTFDYIAKFKMQELKTVETLENEIKNNYEKMKEINQWIKMEFKL